MLRIRKMQAHPLTSNRCSEPVSQNLLEGSITCPSSVIVRASDQYPCSNSTVFRVPFIWNVQAFLAII
jgi:hypothetical protein